MKNFLYLAILLLCFAACKQVEVEPNTKFAKVTFLNTIPVDGPVKVAYKDKVHSLPEGACVTPVGDVHFVFSTHTGKLLLDTVLNISDGDEYRLSRTASLDTIIRKNPLTAVPAAPEGYMRLSIANSTTGPLPYEKVDVILLSNVSMEGENYIPLDTLYSIGTSASEFFLVKKEVIGTFVQNGYRLGFINPITGGRIMNFIGNEFSDGLFTADAPNNVYQISLTSLSLSTSGPASRRYKTIFISPKYYSVTSNLEWYK